MASPRLQNHPSRLHPPPVLTPSNRALNAPLNECFQHCQCARGASRAKIFPDITIGKHRCRATSMQLWPKFLATGAHIPARIGGGWRNCRIGRYRRSTGGRPHGCIQLRQCLRIQSCSGNTCRTHHKAPPIPGWSSCATGRFPRIFHASWSRRSQNFATPHHIGSHLDQQGRQAVKSHLGAQMINQGDRQLLTVKIT